LAVVDRRVTLLEKSELLRQVRGIFNVGSQIWTASYVETFPMFQVRLWLSSYDALYAEMVGLFERTLYLNPETEVRLHTQAVKK
jgi:hypothetical protein